MSEFEQAIQEGGVVLFPSDTVYGLACSPEDAAAVERLYALKAREVDKSAAVMFFSLGVALAALPELGSRTRGALERLMPGGVTVLLPNPRRRWPLACAADPDTLGLRVVSVPAVGEPSVPVLQSSANLSGEPDARTLDAVARAIRNAVDLEIDGGELPGTASTVVDLRGYESGDLGPGAWSIVRQGAVRDSVIAAALDGRFHFDPGSYDATIREGIPMYGELQARLAEASGTGARRILDLGTGTGETAAILLERHPEASLVGIDENPRMLDTARAALPPERVQLLAARLQDPLPAGPFDLVASALAIHHLDAGEKQDLFRRIAAVLRPGGRFALADVVVPPDQADAHIDLTDGYDKPSTLADQRAWLTHVGFETNVLWTHEDLVVLSAVAQG